MHHLPDPNFTQLIFGFYTEVYQRLTQQKCKDQKGAECYTADKLVWKNGQQDDDEQLRTIMDGS